jgi:hypothetical protein
VYIQINSHFTHPSTSFLSLYPSTSVPSTSFTMAAEVSATTVVEARAAALGPPFFFDFFLLGMLADDGDDRGQVMVWKINHRLSKYQRLQCMHGIARKNHNLFTKFLRLFYVCQVLGFLLFHAATEFLPYAASPMKTATIQTQCNAPPPNPMAKHVSSTDRNSTVFSSQIFLRGHRKAPPRLHRICTITAKIGLYVESDLSMYFQEIL